MDGYLWLLGATALGGIVAIYYGYSLLFHKKEPAGHQVASRQHPLP